jgi:predicted deacylase
MHKSIIKLTSLLTLVFTTTQALAKNVEESFFITDQRKEIISLLKNRPEFTLDHLSAKGFELYGPKKTKEFLRQNKIQFTDISMHAFAAKDQYPTPEDIAHKLSTLNTQFPQLSELYTIGKSTKKRDLWVIKLTNKESKKDKPKFKYIANMHGDEIVGRELMVLLAEDLLKNYGKEQRITQLLDNTEIHILASMNPDGAALGRRGNANNVDLNRDFPDFTTRDNADTTNGRQLETKAVMNWQNQIAFKLSANFHGGAEVVNYPWDTSPDQCPNHDLIKDLSLEYATNAPYMATSTVFNNGITNGFEWYEVNGGMQDWSINWKKDLQVTVELSDEKWPNYSTISYYYQENRESLIRYIERIHTF